MAGNQNGSSEGPGARTFAGSFLGPDEQKGQDVLIQRMRAGKHTSEEVLAVLQQRATIEEDYAKKLLKLSKLVMGREESGTLKSSLEVVRLELEQTAKARLDLCHSMRTELERKLAELIVGQATIRKQHQTISEKNMKAKIAQTSVVLKSREKYEARCLEVQQLMSSRTGLPPKEIEKVRLKIESAQGSAKKADGEYQEAVAKLRDIHSKWEQDWRVACEQFQRLEQDRIDFMRQSLWTYANLVSTACVAEDEGCERIRVSLEQLDPAGDMQSFIERNRTGTAVPPPLGYINFYTRSSAPSDGVFASPALSATQGSLSSLSSQMSGLDLKGQNRSNDSIQQTPSNADKPASVINTPRTDYKLGYDAEKKASDPNMSAMPRKASIRRGGSTKGSASTTPASSQAPPPAPAPQDNDGASEVYEAEDDLYFDYDPYDLSVPKPVICWIRVNYEYVPQAKEELHIKKGMTLPVIQQQEDGWWEGEVDDGTGRRRRGLFPSNFASIIPTPTS